MNRKSTQPRQRKLKITGEIRSAYEMREQTLDHDPDAPVMPPEVWDGAVIGRFYRPLKTQVSFRVDNDVLAWLRSKGEGHLSRINAILRETMDAERRAKKSA